MYSGKRNPTNGNSGAAGYSVSHHNPYNTGSTVKVDYGGSAAAAKAQTHSSGNHQPRSTGAGSPAGWSPPTATSADDDLQDETLYFERNRIQHLKDERIHIQKKTFTKWCNSYLNKARLEIGDLFTDFGDGILLMKFLEIISGEKLGKPNRGRMRVQKIENLNKCLEFLKYKRIQLENIGAEDILDGNERLILGLIWTIILRFTIENIEIEGKESGERKHAKEALLLWCQRKTVGYPNVKIDNFTSSWRNGLAFNALIHAHRPELVGFESLNGQEAIGNLNSAFDIAEKKLDIARLLDAEDVNVSHPDEKSIITYVSLFYHYFAKQKTELTGARRVAKVVGGLVEQDELQDDYEQLAADLLVWIQRTIDWLTSRHFPNGLREMQNQLAAFNEYRKVDKPPKYKEKGELEALFFAVQTKRSAMRRKTYQPPDGLLVHDVETAWNRLERAENDRQIALIHELQRQERLEIKAKIFHKKADVRDAWLREIINVLNTNFDNISAASDGGGSAPDGPPSHAQVEAATKMLRNISTEAAPKNDRFKMLSQMSAELQRDNYHGADVIRQREREIVERWNRFLAMLQRKEEELNGLRALTTLCRDLDTCGAELRSAEPQVARNRELGKHQLAVADNLQKHDLIEANINANGEWLRTLKRQALDYIKSKGEQYDALQHKLDDVEREFERLVELCRERRAALARARDYYQFVDNVDEEMQWLAEKQEFCSAMFRGTVGVEGAAHALRQFKALESEMQAHWQRSKGVINAGERLLLAAASMLPSQRDAVQARIGALQQRWEALRTAAATLAKRLSEAEAAQQYFHDANDTESWIREKMPLARSDDYGRDSSAAESLLSRHARLIEEIQAYRTEIQRLDELAQRLSASNGGATASCVRKAVVDVVVEEDDVESETDEPSVTTQVEEIVVPKVVALYAYDGMKTGSANSSSAIRVGKDEILALLDDSNADWWRVLKQDGAEGYVPANYCRVAGSDTVTVSQQVAIANTPSAATRKHRGQNAAETAGGKAENAVLARQVIINADYRRLNQVAATRNARLADAVKLYRFYNHCDSFEAWARDMSALLTPNTATATVSDPKAERDLNDDDASSTPQLLRNKHSALEAEMQGAGTAQLKRVNDTADELCAAGGETSAAHRHADDIRARQRRANKMWRDLQALLAAQAAALASAERRAAFDSLCADTRAWMGEKRELLTRRADEGDLKALQALQRRYQNLERDLRPLDERMRQLERMASELVAAQPEHRADVERTMAELSAAHADLLKQARSRIDDAEQSQGQQMFENAARELLEWAQTTRQKILNNDTEGGQSPPNANSTGAEELVKRHMEVRDEIAAKQYEFDYVRELGNRLLGKTRSAVVRDRMDVLEEARQALADAWSAKDADYKQLLELQVFCREADRIDVLTNGHEAFLDLDTVADTVEGVENLIKAHTDFESKLSAQRERVAAFSASADQLIAGDHRHADYIDRRRVDVLRRRDAVDKAAARRRARLADALIFENLRREANELSAWIAAKKRVAAEVNIVEVNAEQAATTTEGLVIGGPQALDRQLLKHEAFVAELNIHATQLDHIKRDGASLIAGAHCESPRIDGVLVALQSDWSELAQLVDTKSVRLQRASVERQLADAVGDAHGRLDEIVRQLTMSDRTGDGKKAGAPLGPDLRGVKEMIQRDAALEQDVALLRARVDDLDRRARDMEAADGGGGGPRARRRKSMIMGDVASTQLVGALVQRFAALQAPLERRRVLLAESLKCHQLAFDADVELQWIGEKRRCAESRQLAATLTDACNALKKQDQLDVEVAAHRPQVDAILANGSEMLDNGREGAPEKRQFAATIRAKCEELSDAWSALERAVDARRSQLEWGVERERYLFDVAEVESWIGEKHRHLLNYYDGNAKSLDEASAPRVLAAIRQLVKDAEPYAETLRALRAKCEALTVKVEAEKSNGKAIDGDGLEAVALSGRQEKVETDFAFLSELAKQRCTEVESLIHLFTYTSESRELETWINAQLQTALNDDYGRDQEHCAELRTRFDAFRQSVRTGSERFVLCEQIANNLVVRAPPFAREILQRQDQLRAVWTLLLEYIDSRDEKLAVADRLHRFNRDAEELAERMAAKRDALLAAADADAAMVRDAQQAHALILKHEVSENELTQLHEQLRQLMDEAARLQSAYPGPNAEEIGVRLAALAEQWQTAKEAAVARRQRLVATYDLHKFLSQTRDFVGWTQLTQAEMQSEQKVRDLQAAEWIQQEHHRLRAEIETRHGEFAAIRDTGAALLDAGHYASAEIATRIEALETAYQRVKAEWTLRNEWVEQIVDWHGFEREARQNLAAIEARQRTLATWDGPTAAGATPLVEEAESQLRRFETFTRATAQLDERVAALSALAQQLVERRHMESPNIDAWNGKVLAALAELAADIGACRRRLDDALALARFDSEVAEMASWIEEKSKRLRSQQGQPSSAAAATPLSLADKLAHLKRHQALEIELSTNAPRIEALERELDQLKREASGGNCPLAVIDRAERMTLKWRALNAEARRLDAALREARDLFDFNESAARVQRWIADKEVLLGANELGNDYEHAKQLLDRLIGKDADQSVDASTIQHANNLGAKLIASTSSVDARAEIQATLDELNEAWNRFVGRMAEYRRALEAALEVHRFNGDVDDTNARIQEKAALLGSADVGANLAAVEQLLRKQDATERDMSAIHRKLNEHDAAAKQLLDDPNLPLRDTIAAALRKLEVSWHDLAQLAHSRRLNLQQSYNLQKFFDAVKKSEQWSATCRSKMSSYAPARSVRDAQALLKAHDERLAEIDARNDELKALRECAQRIAAEQPSHRAEIQRALRRLQNIEHQTRQSWEHERMVLQRVLQLQTLNAQIVHTESWLAAKEAFVNQYESGDSVDAVEQLQRKLDTFTQALRSQTDKVEALRCAAAEIFDVSDAPSADSTAEPPEMERVREKYAEMLRRYDQLLAGCETRRKRLDEARQLHTFIRECGEVIMWMNAKLQLAYDDAFIDPTNLRSKLQKHLAFDAELTASAERVEAVRREGEALIAGEHFEKERVEAQLNEVLDGWNELKTKSARKAKHLTESYETYQLLRRLAEFDKWLDQVEHALSTNDHGEDIVSVEALLTRHDKLKAEIDAKRTTITETCRRPADLRKMDYENVDELVERADELLQRFDGLAEPCQIRRDNLSDSLRFFQWSSEVDEQLAWCADKCPQLESSDYGRSLHAAQSLHKKHQILEQEINTRAPIIEALLRDSRVSAALADMDAAVCARVERLRSAFQQLGALSAKRAQRLVESLRSQEYYAEAGEAEQWMRERLQVIMSAKDAASASDATASPLPTATADAHLRRLAALEQEIDAFTDEVERLRAMCDQMTDAAHFDSMLLTTRQAKLEELFDALRRECRSRRAQLVDASRYHAFVRQIDDLSATLRDKKLLADREDYGTDLEDCCALIEQFEQVVRELSAAGERVAAVQKAEEELLRGSHPNAASIRAKSGDLRQLWRDVNEAANERQQALLDGKNIHVFDQRADEMLNRLAEQEAYLVALDAEELTNCDAATVRAFVQKHDDFLHALYAVEKQVNEACREADRIIQLFPRTRDHLEVRRSELSEQLKDVQDGARAFSERLAQAQNNQTYFQEYRDLMNWTRHIHTLITGEILARDVAGCEALNARHAEYRAEIQAHESQRAVFVDTGKRMIAAGNALAPEIGRKIDDLSEAFRQLYDVWHRRQAVYDENLDVQQWLAGAESLDAWLSERQQYLADDWRVADGVEAVDDLIRQFDDFLATLDAQAPHVDALRRLTKLEQSYAKMRESEQQQQRADRERQQQEAAAAANRRDTQQIKTLEKKKLLQEKRQERERRKTQEISILRRTPSQENAGDFLSASVSPGSGMMSASTTLPRARHRASVASVELLLQQQQQFNNNAPESNNRTIISVNTTVQQQQESNNKRTSIILDRPPSALIGSSTSASVAVTETAPVEEFTSGAELRRRPSSATSGGGGGATTTRTPGFTTRRSQSIKKMRQWDDLKSIDMHGYIDRKQELQGGGKKATFRSWKNYHTILCGQLLCFFKDEESFMENMAAAPPVYILNARCEVYADYVKRKHTFRLNSTDGAEYLFAAENGTKMIEWVEKINFHARLAPSNQLASFQTTGLECDAASIYRGGAYPTATSSARNSMCLDALSSGTSSYVATGKYATLDHLTIRQNRSATVATAPAPLVPPPSALQNGSGASTRSTTFSQFSVVDALPRANSRGEEIHNRSQSQATSIYEESNGRSSSSGTARFSPRSAASTLNNGSGAADPTADFVNWVETNNGKASTLPSAHHHIRGGSGDDADSLSSAATAGGTSMKKRSVISLFKRSSKRT